MEPSGLGCRVSCGAEWVVVMSGLWSSVGCGDERVVELCVVVLSGL